MRLAQVCEDIAARYQQYTDGEQSLWSENAPSNLRYCIENTATGDLYTNFGAESYDAGAEILQERPEYTMLYESTKQIKRSTPLIPMPVTETHTIVSRFANWSA